MVLFVCNYLSVCTLAVMCGVLHGWFGTENFIFAIVIRHKIIHTPGEVLSCFKT